MAVYIIKTTNVFYDCSSKTLGIIPHKSYLFTVVKNKESFQMLKSGNWLNKVWQLNLKA